MRDAALRAIAIQRVPSLDAEAGLERSGRVVDAGVDDLGVARAGVLADRALRFQHRHFAAGEGESSGDSQPDPAGADDGGIGEPGHACLIRRSVGGFTAGSMRRSRSAPCRLRPDRVFASLAEGRMPSADDRQSALSPAVEADVGGRPFAFFDQPEQTRSLSGEIDA